MKVTIFTPPGLQVEEIRNSAVEVLHELGVSADVEVDSNEFDFALAGVLLSPAVSINGTLISNGWIPERDVMKDAISDLRR